MATVGSAGRLVGMPDKATLIASSLIISLAACGQPSNVNPPTEPAQPVAAPATGGPSSAVGAQDRAAFTGRWAADAAWCGNTSATTDQVPIEITTTEFRGYENRCAIGEVSETDAGWEAQLACQSEGTTSNERVRFSVAGEAMTVSWLDRDTGPMTLVRCPVIGSDVPAG